MFVYAPLIILLGWVLNLSLILLLTGQNGWKILRLFFPGRHTRVSHPVLLKESLKAAEYTSPSAKNVYASVVCDMTLVAGSYGGSAWLLKHFFTPSPAPGWKLTLVLVLLMAGADICCRMWILAATAFGGPCGLCYWMCEFDQLFSSKPPDSAQTSTIQDRATFFLMYLGLFSPLLALSVGIVIALASQIGGHAPM